MVESCGGGRELRLGRVFRNSLLLVLFVPWLAASTALAADPPEPAGQPLEATVDDLEVEKPAPVEFDGHVLYYVRTRVGNRSAADRARAIEQRIQEVADGKEPVGPLRVLEGYASDIFLGDRFIASITEGDTGSRENRAFYAQVVGRRMAEGIDRYRAERAPEALLRSATRAAVLTGALVVFLLLARLLRRRAGPRLARAAESALARMRVQRFELIRPEMQRRLIRGAGLLLWWGMVLLGVLAWAEAVAHLFPWTRIPADRALQFTLGAVKSVALSVLGFIPNLVYIALFVAVGWGVNALTRIFFRAVRLGAIQIPGFFPDWARTTSLIVTTFVFALVAVAIYPYLPGSGSSAFQAIGILLGAMISLGSGSSVANAISGVILTYMRPFVVGDFVRIADTTGTVTEQSLLAVRMITIRNEHVTLPASMVLSSQILNFSTQARTQGVAIRTGVTIGYDTPWRTVHGLLLSAASRTSGVRKDPAPWVIQTELHDFYVRYELDAYVDDPARQHFVLSELNQNVQDAFFEAGVEILSPHYAQLRDGSRTAIPPEHAPAGDGVRAFPVEVRDRAGGGNPGA